jgi:hypothetical protein
MGRRWQDLMPAKITAIQVWFQTHKGSTKATIEEVDQKSGIGKDAMILAIRINIDDTWLRVNKTNALRLAKRFGDDVDKWIGKNVLISQDQVLFKGELTPSMKIEPVK